MSSSSFSSYFCRLSTFGNRATVCFVYNNVVVSLFTPSLRTDSNNNVTGRFVSYCLYYRKIPNVLDSTGFFVVRRSEDISKREGGYGACEETGDFTMNVHRGVGIESIFVIAANRRSILKIYEKLSV